MYICSQGDFTVIVDLVKGRHEYKFFVDGEWLHDPDEVRDTFWTHHLSNVMHA